MSPVNIELRSTSSSESRWKNDSTFLSFFRSYTSAHKVTDSERCERYRSRWSCIDLLLDKFRFVVHSIAFIASSPSLINDFLFFLRCSPRKISNRGKHRWLACIELEGIYPSISFKACQRVYLIGISTRDYWLFSWVLSRVSEWKWVE